MMAVEVSQIYCRMWLRFYYMRGPCYSWRFVHICYSYFPSSDCYSMYLVISGSVLQVNIFYIISCIGSNSIMFMVCCTDHVISRYISSKSELVYCFGVSFLDCENVNGVFCKNFL
uniref:Uncharacterized protein n=1 Tax=Cacopsylla melanoneura TaxID=428564 RepID=A0A8D9FDR3_9HEMI